jgi:methyltransferase family protein
MSQQEQPTGDYQTLLYRIHRHLRPRTYLEIGVSEGKSLAQVLPETVVVGVDPVSLALDPVSCSPKLFSITSDRFFEEHDLSQELGGLPLDMAFIDGMHLFEFALRDFINIERSSHANTVILIHDCYPIDAETAARERTTLVWSGDVWKLIVCLKEYRPDLCVAVAASPYTGLGIVTRLDPVSTVLRDRYDEICERFTGLDYDQALGQSKDEALNRVDGDWETVRSLLDADRTAGRAANPIGTD